MQRSRLLIILGIFLELVIVGILVFAYIYSDEELIPSPPSIIEEKSGIATTQVIVALQPIGRGFELVPGLIGRRYWPTNNVPPDTVADESETIGKVARTDIAQGEIVVRSMLIDISEWELPAYVPAAADGIAYFGRNDGYLYALDGETGQERWRFKPEDRVFSAPAVANGLVYLVGGDGRLYAIEAKTGQEAWTFTSLTATYTLEPATPIVREGVAYYENRGGGFFHALDVETGQEKWHFKLQAVATSADEQVYAVNADGEIYAQDNYSTLSKTAIADGKVYFISANGNLHAVVEAQTGEVTKLETYRVPTRDNVPITTPVIVKPQGRSMAQVIVALQPIDRGSAFVVGSMGRRAYPIEFVPPDIIADEAETIGKVAERNIAPGEIIVRSMLGELSYWQVSSAPIISNGMLYIRYNNGRLYAIDLKLDREMWNYLGFEQITVADDIFYYFGYSGFAPPPLLPSSSPALYAVDALTGQGLWRFDAFTFPSATIVADGVIYFSGEALTSPSVEAPPPITSLYAVDTKTGEKLWQFMVEDVVLSGPAIADGTVYVTGSDGYFYAVDRETGQERWRVKP